MLVEFFGLPGAGKSSMSRHVAEMLLRRGVAVDEITYDVDHGHRRPVRAALKAARILQYASANPRKTLVFGTGIFATRQATFSDFARSALNWIYIASLAAHSRSVPRTVLLDQGIAQALWSIGFAARRERWLSLLDKSMDEVIGPDLVVHVCANPQTIRLRLAQRVPQVSRLERVLGMDDEPLRRAEAHFRAVVRTLSTHGISAIEVTNDSPEERAWGAERIATLIASMLNDRRAESDTRLRAESSCAARGNPAAQDSPTRFADRPARGRVT